MKEEAHCFNFQGIVFFPFLKNLFTQHLYRQSKEYKWIKKREFKIRRMFPQNITKFYSSSR